MQPPAWLHDYVHDELRELRERIAMERALVRLAANEVEWIEDDDELVPRAAVNSSPSCPQCGAPLDEHNSRGECPPY